MHKLLMFHVKKIASERSGSKSSSKDLLCLLLNNELIPTRASLDLGNPEEMKEITHFPSSLTLILVLLKLLSSIFILLILFLLLFIIDKQHIGNRN